MANSERAFDLRTLERNLTKGIITREEYDEYLAKLPDAAENAAPVESEFVEGILKEEDGEAEEGES